MDKRRLKYSFELPSNNVNGYEDCNSIKRHIPMYYGRPDRDNPISKDEITNLIIDLNINKDSLGGFDG